MSYYLIYKTTCSVNNKIYVGQHIQHETLSFDGYYGSGSALGLSIKKYGTSAFEREIIEFAAPPYVNEREIFWIDCLSATDRDIGYNISKGGLGANYDIFGLNNPNYGNNWSDEQKEQLRQQRLGHKQSKETIEKRRLKNIGKKRSDVFVVENKRRMIKLNKENPNIFNTGGGTIWMNDGTCSKRIKLGLINDFIINGFVKGRI